MSTAERGRSPLPQLAVIAFLAIAMIAYCVIIGDWAWRIMRGGGAAGVGLGVAVLVLPLIGVWMLWAILRNGFAHQRLVRLAREAGRDLDVSGLPTMPSGRVQRAAADELFASVKAEYEADPGSWLAAYRLARAYDYAGDRPRARSWMTKAVGMEREQR
ncbi:hypothetical protein P0W64_12010 [Tsukamurella sp. 8F]|uniref:hypothetical protein n=1 Tax=unclassified Tsukamurella TaxID=2633480 RepID=UPI0023B8D15E|nr:MULTISPECIES: hypothetical protein [unclassified Tsukamurella]MDF0531439.1 hypothetical protein [Tsukamurella sp. 8J]MDF0587498.1 hypothetical protein [Tsukamurella sp. 8F]